MTQTQRQRMRAHYKSLKRKQYRQKFPAGTAWLWLARAWKVPVREAKGIVRPKEKKEEEPS